MSCPRAPILNKTQTSTPFVTPIGFKNFWLRCRRNKKSNASHNFVRGVFLVPRTGFEPVVSALRGLRPGPLDERGGR